MLWVLTLIPPMEIVTVHRVTKKSSNVWDTHTSIHLDSDYSGHVIFVPLLISILTLFYSDCCWDNAIIFYLCNELADSGGDYIIWGASAQASCSIEYWEQDSIGYTGKRLLAFEIDKWLATVVSSVHNEYGSWADRIQLSQPTALAISFPCTRVTEIFRWREK